MTRDEEEELILEALEARAEKMHKGEKSHQEQLAKELLAEREEKKKEAEKAKRENKFATWIAIVIIVGLVIAVWNSIQNRPQWQKDIEAKINHMTKSQILDYTANLYLSDEDSREFNYILDTWGIRCSKLNGVAACVFNSDYPEKPVGTSINN